MCREFSGIVLIAGPIAQRVENNNWLDDSRQQMFNSLLSQPLLSIGDMNQTSKWNTVPKYPLDFIGLNDNQLGLLDPRSIFQSFAM